MPYLSLHFMMKIANDNLSSPKNQNTSKLHLQLLKERRKKGKTTSKEQLKSFIPCCGPDALDALVQSMYLVQTKDKILFLKTMLRIASDSFFLR